MSELFAGPPELTVITKKKMNYPELTKIFKTPSLNFFLIEIDCSN